MLRIVLDTNIVISGLIWRGTPHHLLVALTEDKFAAFTSYPLISELTRKLLGTKLGSELLKRDISAQQLVMNYSALCEVVSPSPLAQAVSRDTDDDSVLACAKAAQADLIVSGDQDLLVLQRFEGIPIITALQALDRLKA
ncbi:MAG: putative toxin-antitoxin system toxin component, PIN family [Pseudomonadota bacterium]|uniref:putative toxin-antitoxin system toxin component, PIN family n=1 Tax=Polaromonas sp. TaxID=1869339 RepID=UPI0025D166F1|nr:putative toxin-antitoxin system toxin component, PIN family [Polaromonas sp.]MDQ3273236.1 putative toxin-antitoxin system toxin component, PIN family [Pseudomonadota bacterium]